MNAWRVPKAAFLPHFYACILVPTSWGQHVCGVGVFIGCLIAAYDSNVTRATIPWWNDMDISFGCSKEDKRIYGYQLVVN